MGVKELWALLSYMLATCNLFDAMAGRTLGIDIRVWPYQIAADQRNVPRLHPQGDFTLILDAIGKRLDTFKEHGISPVSCLTVSEHGPRRDLTQLVANKFYRVSMAQHVFVKLPFRDGNLVLVFDNAT